MVFHVEQFLQCNHHYSWHYCKLNDILDHAVLQMVLDLWYYLIVKKILFLYKQCLLLYWLEVFFLRCFFKDFINKQPFSSAYGSFIMFFGITFFSCCFIGDNYFLLLVKYFIDIIKNLCDEPVWIVLVNGKVSVNTSVLMSSNDQLIISNMSTIN